MAATALALAAGLAAAQIDLSAGIEWQSGDYGYDETTTATFAPLGLSADFGDWAVNVANAWARIDGPAAVGLLDPTGPRRRGRPEPVDARRSGFSDTSVSVEYRPAPAAAAWYALEAGATLPTGDEGEGLGTGATDVFLLGEAGVDAEPFAVALSVGYRITGAPGWRDPFSLAASVSRRFGREGVAGLGLDYTQPLADGFDPQASVSLFAGRSLAPGLQMDLRAWKGLNRSSGDFGGGLTLRRVLGAAGR